MSYKMERKNGNFGGIKIAFYNHIVMLRLSCGLLLKMFTVIIWLNL